MSRLPICSGQDAIRAFQKLGYQLDHQTGSRVILRQEEQIQPQRTFVRRTGELNGSLSGSARSTLLLIVMNASTIWAVRCSRRFESAHGSEAPRGIRFSSSNIQISLCKKWHDNEG
jgi:predicted RNA binding protein YcfA (HicA-like mRNA interferase family)